MATTKKTAPKKSEQKTAEAKTVELKEPDKVKDGEVANPAGPRAVEEGDVAVKSPDRVYERTSTAQESSTPQKSSLKQTPREPDAVGQPQSAEPVRLDEDADYDQTYDEVGEVTPVHRDVEDASEERTKKGAERRKEARKAREKGKDVRFVSRAVDLRVLGDPEDYIRNERGQVIKSYPGSAVEFVNNTFVAGPDDKMEYLGDEVKTSEFLRKHPDFNIDFWEVGNAPGESKPTVDEQNSRIIRALAARDAEEILEVVREERETHKRDTVYNAAETALESIAGTGDVAEAARIKAGASDERAK